MTFQSSRNVATNALRMATKLGDVTQAIAQGRR